MGAVEILGLAASVSLLAGWRLYLCVFAVGLAMRLHVVPLPEQLSALAVLAHPWVIGVAAVGALAEFFADKIAWIDSAWDGVHTLVRPLGGAVLALALVDAHDPVWQVCVLLLGGGAALLTHSAKASTRAAVNLSPEPFSNVALSGTEDAATAAALAISFINPFVAAVVAMLVLIVAVAAIALMGRLMRVLKARMG